MVDAGCKTLDMIEKIVEKGNGKVDLYLTIGADNLKCSTPVGPKTEVPVDKKIIKNK
jgi:3-hydroxymyristoyl/3-hydroxydecanoyl-(acyl carrier protein) dehydratase